MSVELQVDPVGVEPEFVQYEVVDQGRALALTLLRCTGKLSGTDMAYRPWPAGPPLPAEGAQMSGRQVLRYAVHVGDGNPYALVDDAFLPLEVAVADGGGDRPSAARQPSRRSDRRH